MAADKFSKNNNPKSSRSRNVERIYEVHNSCQNKDVFNTQRAHRQLFDKNNLLKMFTTFLSNDSRGFNSRKGSARNEIKNSIMSHGTVKHSTKKNTLSNKSKVQDEKSIKDHQDSFNIFKSKDLNKDKLDVESNNNDIFNLNDIKDDFLDFSIHSIGNQK